MNYDISFWQAFKRLIIKILLWDRAIYYYFNQALVIWLILLLDKEVFKVIVYGIASIYNLVLIGEINFDKVKTDINIGKQL